MRSAKEVLEQNYGFGLSNFMTAFIRRCRMIGTMGNNGCCSNGASNGYRRLLVNSLPHSQH